MTNLCISTICNCLIEPTSEYYRWESDSELILLFLMRQPNEKMENSYIITKKRVHRFTRA